MGKKIRLVLAVCVPLPIWLYLLFKVLSMVGATELMWFLYGAYVPATLIVGLLAALDD